MIAFAWITVRATTRCLWRQEIIRAHWKKWVWRDAPPGEPHEIQLDDDDGHPCETAWGLHVTGEFVRKE